MDRGGEVLRIDQSAALTPYFPPDQHEDVFAKQALPYGRGTER